MEGLVLANVVGDAVTEALVMAKVVGKGVTEALVLVLLKHRAKLWVQPQQGMVPHHHHHRAGDHQQHESGPQSS